MTCCYAVQDKVWVDDPDGAPWEIYTVLADSPTPQGTSLRAVDPSCSCGLPAAAGDPMDEAAGPGR